MNRTLILLSAGAVLFAQAAVAVETPTPKTAPAAFAPPKRGPGYDLALEAAREAVGSCMAKGFKIAASVVDSGGVTRATLAADGAPQIAVQSSAWKAVNSVRSGTTSGLAQARAKKDPAYAAQVRAQPDELAHQGAVPLMVGGVVVGAIGVGGAASEQDELCAQAGAAKIADRLK